MMIVQQQLSAQPTHSHALMLVWAFATIAAIEALFIIIVLKRKHGWDSVSEAPTTNVRILVSIILSVIVVLGVGVVGLATGVWPPEAILNSFLLFIVGMMGLDVAQFGFKRFTMDREPTSPPANPDASTGTDTAQRTAASGGTRAGA